MSLVTSWFQQIAAYWGNLRGLSSFDRVASLLIGVPLPYSEVVPTYVERETEEVILPAVEDVLGLDNVASWIRELTSMASSFLAYVLLGLIVILALYVVASK